MENRELTNKPCSYGKLIYDKEQKNTQWGKDSLFNKWCWQNWTTTCERIALVSHTIHKNTKWIKELNVRPKT